MPNETVKITFASDDQTKADVARIERELKRIEQLQDEIGKTGVRSTEEIERKTRSATRRIKDDYGQLIEVQQQIQKAGEEVPRSLINKYRTLFTRIESGFETIRGLQKRLSRESEQQINRRQASEKKASDQAIRNAKQEESARLRIWREEQRLFERNKRSQERLDRDQIARAQELLGILSQVGQAASFAGSRGLNLSFETIEAAKFFEQLTERLQNIEGSAEAAERQLERFKEAVRLPGVTFEVLSQFAVQMGRVNIQGEELVNFVTEFANAASLYGLEAGATTRVLRQLIDTIDKGKISQQDLNSLNESGGFIASSLKRSLGGLAVTAENLNKVVGMGAENWAEFWIESIGGDLAGQTRARTDTITVAQENLSAAVLRTKAAFGEELVPAYLLATGALEKLALAMESLPDPLQGIIAGTVVAGSATLSFGGRVLEVASDLGILALALKGTGGVTAALGLFKVALAPVAAAIVPFSAIVGSALVLVGGITTAFYGWARVLGIVKDEIKPVTIETQELNDRMKELRKELDETGKSFGTVSANGRTMLNIMVSGVDDAGSLTGGLKNLTEELVILDDELERSQALFSQASNLAEIQSSAEAQIEAINNLEQKEIEQIETELMGIAKIKRESGKLTEEQIAKAQELEARKTEIQLKANRDRERVRDAENQKIDRIEDQMDQKAKNRREASLRDAKTKSEQRARIAQSLASMVIDSINDTLKQIQNTEAAIVEAKKESAAFISENDRLLNEQTVQNALTTLDFYRKNELLKADIAIAEAQKAFDAALESGNGIQEAENNLTAAIRAEYDIRLRHAEQTIKNEQQLIYARTQLARKLEGDLSGFREQATDKYESQLQEVKEALERINELTEQWGNAAVETGDKQEISFQQGAQWGIQLLGIVNDITDSYQSLNDQLDRLDRRTDRSIERIKQRARDQGRPLTPQEQRRIADIKEDASLRKLDIQDRNTDNLTRTIFAGVGTIAGGVIGFIAGGPPGAALGAGIGGQAGNELGRTAGNIFHSPQNDLYAQYAGMRTAAMTESQIMNQNRTNAMDFSNYFSRGYEKQIATRTAQSEISSTPSQSINIENKFYLGNRELKVMIEEIIDGQRNQTLPRFEI